MDKMNCPRCNNNDHSFERDRRCSRCNLSQKEYKENRHLQIELFVNEPIHVKSKEWDEAEF